MEGSMRTVRVERDPGREYVGAAMDLDTIMSADTRAVVRDLVEEGRSFIPRLADWGRRARPLLDHPLPEDAYEDQDANEIVMNGTGLAELNDIMFLIGLVVGDPDSPPSETVVERLVDEYADLIAGTAS